MNGLHDVAAAAAAVLTTIALYAASLHLQRKAGINALLFSAGALIFLLAVTGLPYETYAKGGDLLTLFLGPATAALAVPLYKYRHLLIRNKVPLAAGVTAGTCVSIVVNGGVMYVWGSSRELIATVLPKSTTTPIAIELVERLGGMTALGATITVLTGLFGSIVGVWWLKLLRVADDMAVGTAIGTSSHGIGTAKVYRDSELAGAYSSVAMGLTGIALSLLLIPFFYLLG